MNPRGDTSLISRRWHWLLVVDEVMVLLHRGRREQGGTTRRL